MGRSLNLTWPWRAWHTSSLRQKLLALVLLPLLGVLPLLGLLLLLWSNAAFDRLLITKVRADLAVAQGYFERVLGEVGAGIDAVAQAHMLHLALAKPISPQADAELVALLQRYKARAGLDFINLRAADGRLRFTDSGPALTTDRQSPAFTTVASALQREDSTLQAGASVELLQAEQLALLGPTLRERVPVKLVPTRNAAPSPRQVEDRALVLLSTRPVRGDDGRLLGHVQGGVLLNRNLPFIDHLNGIVYADGSLPFTEWGSRGTATLFLDDVRISTNVRLFGTVNEERAIGTRVSHTVREAVLGQGRTWLDRAFVVNEWYVSGYEPLSDSQGRRVGMLYVGFLEKPFTWLKYGALASIGVVFFAVMLLAAAVSLRWARTLFSPIERMEATMQRVKGGELAARVGPLPSQDEIGRLATHLDELLATQQGWHAALDAKVAERTQQLATTQDRLVRSEKLATIGQLTASIAHEVNNPIAVIQGNLDLMRELLSPEACTSVRAEFQLVDEQIERMRLIVTQLLQFARPGEYAGYVQRVDPAPLLADCLVLVGHQLAHTHIEVQRECTARQAVAINRQELQQVLVNLLVNALHAMPEGGRLTLRCLDAEPGWVHLQVQDSGPGLSAQRLADLFQPFATGKKDGTGLGLWISRGLVERYGGDITATNAHGVGGAVFTVRLKAAG